jgi:hypothetical protein
MIFTEEEHKKHLRDGTLITERSHPFYSHPNQETPAKPDPSRPRNEPMPTNTTSKKAHPSERKSHPAMPVEAAFAAGGDSLVVNPPRDQTKIYCICSRQNDNKQYIECEDQCEWYHPECVGFDSELIKKNQNNMLFLCPMCKDETKSKVQKSYEGKNSHYLKIESK